jgi:TPR repeat protein
MPAKATTAKDDKEEKLILHPWVVGLICTFIGIVGGYGVAIYQDPITSFFEERWCHGITLLKAGKALRKEAIRPDHDRNVNIDEMHERSNEAFSAAKKCGIAEAGAYLGQAYCYGWGVQVNETMGWMLIRDAVQNDPKLGSEWFSDKAYCPHLR